MQSRARRHTLGFTLTELAIVLAVVGVLAAGLYNLISSANQQVRDQGSATQQEQLISAVKAFLASQYGSPALGYMTTNSIPAASGGCGGVCGVSSSFSLPLPSSSACNDYGDGNWKHICDFLPPGFTSATTNSYGQSYAIRILRDSTAAGSPPVTYSFMIMTSIGSGTTITDTSGARIASLIGGDGGFIYNSNVCGAPINAMVCGTYGAWQVNAATGYGFGSGGSPAPASGTIASRTYASPEQSSTYPWLARSLLPADNPNTPTYNTMSTNLFLGGALNTFYLGNSLPATTGGGTINMQGGTISGTGLSNITLTGDPTTTVPLITAVNPATCTMTAPGVPNTCPYAVQATTMNVVNFLNASSLYAGLFIYQNSDIRLKTNIHPVQNSLQDVMKLKPVSFTFKSNGKESLGVIAQDIEQVYPQLVSPGSGGMKAVNYEGLVAPLIGAVQELKHENDDLRQEVEEQALRQKKLEQELHAHDGPK